jgi:2-polyprenyl-3-methyl-5-hydroxy-6-metoxy-1,4-benzoquinol methylase
VTLQKAVPYGKLPSVDLLQQYPLARALALHFKNETHQFLHHETTLALLPDMTDLTLLDFGCGLGDLTGMLPVEMQSRYLGTDANRDSIKAAKLLNPGWKFRWQKKVASADVIVAIGVISDYFVAPEKLLRDMWDRCSWGVIFTCWQHFNSQEGLEALCPAPLDVVFKRDDFLAVAMYK